NTNAGISTTNALISAATIIAGEDSETLEDAVLSSSGAEDSMRSPSKARGRMSTINKANSKSSTAVTGTGTGIDIDTVTVPKPKPRRNKSSIAKSRTPVTSMVKKSAMELQKRDHFTIEERVEMEEDWRMQARLLK